MKQKENVISRLIRMAKPIRWYLLLGAALSILAVISAVTATELMGQSIQKLYDFWMGGCRRSVRDALAGSLLLLLAVYAAGSLLGYANAYLMNNVVTRFFTCDLRTAISDKLRRLPVRYVDQTPVGDIMSRMNGDVGEMGGYLHQIFDILVKGCFQIVLIAAAMFREDWRLAIFVVMMTPLSVLLSTRLASRSEKHFDEMFKKSGDLTEIVEEAFSNYQTTKAYNLEEYTIGKHAAVNEALKNAGFQARFTMSVVQPLIRFSGAVAYMLINLIGGYLTVQRGVSVEAVVTIILFARQFSAPLEELSYGFARINSVKAAAKRVFEILDMEEEPDGTEAAGETVRGSVEFTHVDFSYDPEKPLIEDLNLTVSPGRKVAIVGPTGAGKTTIVNLLMRFYDIGGGTIRLDGQDTSLLPRERVRSAFGMVLQDTWLFRGTIAENVAYGKPGATRAEIEEACSKTYCDHFIRTMPDGYDTVIGEDTTNLSGGQKQLLTIARALLAAKPLLILDEATSNVDTRTELQIQRAMDELMAGRTCFVIAHRLSTIVNSDCILVLDHGRIVEQGTHRELLERRGFYYRLYTSQYAV